MLAGVKKEGNSSLTRKFGHANRLIDWRIVGPATNEAPVELMWFIYSGGLID